MTMMTRTTIIMTDVKDALPLIQTNIQSNRSRVAPDIGVVAKELRWGKLNVKKLNLQEPLDTVVASDVIYEPDHLKTLLETLVELCTPGRTQVFVGYKPRGLDPEIEDQFFRTLIGTKGGQGQGKFMVTDQFLLGYGVRVYCLRRQV